MKVYPEVFSRSLTKRGEELCGDSVEVVQSGEGIIAVMADGLGSGVKASILSTLTARIASTMVENKACIEEVVKTLIDTLPVCRVRGLAYSTFSILEISDDGEVRLFEFDNPALIYIRDGKLIEPPYTNLKIEERIIREYGFKARPGDKLFLVSDGVVHAGIGGILNLGWQRGNVCQYLQKLDKRGCFVSEMVDQLIKTCNHMYANNPGDDTTVVGVGIREPQMLTMLVGPPLDRSRDGEVVEKLISSEGKKVVCGGTTANIVSRETGKKIVTNIDYADAGIPPVGSIEGVDLVTEGFITLNRCTEMLRNFVNRYSSSPHFLDEVRKKRDGASRLLDMLVNHSTHIRFLVGQAVNPAHRNPYLPEGASNKLKIVEELAEILQKCGKRVAVELY